MNHVAANSSLVKVSGLCKTFGNYRALDHVSLNVAGGERVAIIGSSGSGKTTLLRCIAHLEKPNSGEVIVAGRYIGDRFVDGQRTSMSDREIADIRTGIGMVFQRFNLFPHLTALENIMLGPLKVLRRPRDEVEPEARGLLEKVGLPQKANAYPDHLSGGQQQRIAIARSLAMKPKLMLFDEATSALDPELVGEVLDVMQQLANEGMTMLIVTHEMSFAEEVADRIIVMDHGAVVDEGAPRDLLSKPAHPRTMALLRPQRDRRSASPTGLAS
ncbi:amino acid ABC transporter ATP-binding protein [Bradyrhizobium sp. UFLA05-112]